MVWHAQNGIDVSETEYVERYRTLLLAGLAQPKKVYLDTNYWVRLRKAEREESNEAAELLKRLRQLVRSRKVICVLHLYSFLELAKQEEGSLRVTARIVDELTEGVATASVLEQRAWDCAEYITAKLQLEVGKPLCNWTKIGHLHSQQLPAKMPGPVTSGQRATILKAVVDSTWNTTLTHVFNQIDWNRSKLFSADIEPDVLVKIDDERLQRLASQDTGKIVRQQEFTQILRNVLVPIFTSQLTDWHVNNGFPAGISGILHDIQTIVQSAQVEFNSRSLGRFLPSVTIPIDLFTLFVTGSHKKQIGNNDWVDWHHAASALANCDLFFTERHLASVLRQELRAEKQYGCGVAGTLDEAMRLLDKIPND